MKTRLVFPKWIRSAHALLVFHHLPKDSVSFPPHDVDEEQRAFLIATNTDRDYVEGDCFANTRHLVLRGHSTRFHYCEGYLIRYDNEDERAIAYHHAWALLDRKIVVELSTRLSPTEGDRDFGQPLEDRPVGHLPSHWFYAGVLIDETSLPETTGPVFRGLPTTLEDPDYVKSFIRLAKERQPLWDDDKIYEYIARDLETDPATFRTVYGDVLPKNRRNRP